MDAAAITGARKREALRHALGQTILHALDDPDVVEILANPDGRVVLDHLVGGRRDCGARLGAGDRERVIRLVADHMGLSISPQAPSLAGVLPTGERFQALTPPISPEPMFSIRKRPARIWTLDDYQRAGALSTPQVERLKAAVAQRQNLLIVGGAGSGKTTLANALLAEPAFAGDRVILIEDVPELRCSAWDLVPLLTRRGPHPTGVVDLVRDALRLRPDRIVIGEMRDGATALETLKAWNTGHPGGLSTLHANSAQDALPRLADLLAEVTLRRPEGLIGQAVDLIVPIRRTAGGRVVDPLFEARSK